VSGGGEEKPCSGIVFASVTSLQTYRSAAIDARNYNLQPGGNTASAALEPPSPYPWQQLHGRRLAQMVTFVTVVVPAATMFSPASKATASSNP
jgi:hypothetical protein